MKNRTFPLWLKILVPPLLGRNVQIKKTILILVLIFLWSPCDATVDVTYHADRESGVYVHKAIELFRKHAAEYKEKYDISVNSAVVKSFCTFENDNYTAELYSFLPMGDVAAYGVLIFQFSDGSFKTYESSNLYASKNCLKEGLLWGYNTHQRNIYIYDIARVKDQLSFISFKPVASRFMDVNSRGQSFFMGFGICHADLNADFEVCSNADEHVYSIFQYSEKVGFEKVGPQSSWLYVFAASEYLDALAYPPERERYSLKGLQNRYSSILSGVSSQETQEFLLKQFKKIIEQE